MNKFQILFIAIFTLSIISCSEESSIVPQDSYTECMDEFNPSNNPFIWMASYHNDNLEKVFQAVTVNPTIQTFRDEVNSIAPQFEIFPFQFAEVIEGTETYVDYVNRQADYSVKVKDYTIQMINIVEGEGDVISNLVNVESLILSDSGLSNMERDALLQGYAIAQGSYCYWTNNYQNWSNSKAVPDWAKKVISADAVTAVSMAVGIGVGWLIPPVTVGAGIWTAGSSVGVSAATGLMMAVDWVLDEFTTWW